MSDKILGTKIKAFPFTEWNWGYEDGHLFVQVEGKWIRFEDWFWTGTESSGPGPYSVSVENECKYGKHGHL